MGAKSPDLFTDARALVTPYGIRPSGIVHRNLGVAGYYQIAVQRGQAAVMRNGALLQDTTPFHGRAAKSSFYVNDPAVRFGGRTLDELIAWGNPAAGAFDNLPIAPEVFQRLRARVVAHLSSAPDVFVVDGFSGRTPRARLAVRTVTGRAPSALFAHAIFLRPTEEELVGYEAGWTILHAPEVEAEPDDGTNGPAFIVTHLGERTTIIGGTRYHGQIKKCIFSVQNFLLPLKGVLTMHAGCSEGTTGASALHAGLSGTGKTTLSNTGYPVADDQIVVEIDADDPDAVVSNMEGGQYAKTEKLRRDKEPEIWDAIGYGTTAENLAVAPDGSADYDDCSITANGRVGYPLEYVPSQKSSGTTRAPSNITFLTADAYGVLPPVALLTVEGAMYHFAAGFTSRMPGTEQGVSEPKPVFSSFFGKPFMPLKAHFYTELLGRLVQHFGTRVWLVNTGWMGPQVPGRERVDILVSKAIINAVRDGEVDLDPSNFWFDPVFKLHVPKRVPGVDPKLLDARNFWSDPAAYAAKANELAGIFRDALAKMPNLPPDVVAAGPAPVG